MPSLRPHRKSQTNRRGITLLATISMIVLFMLLGTAFVMVSARFMRESKYRSIQVEHSGDDARTLVRRAFMDILRGQSLYEVGAPLRGHSLLGDEYAYGFKGLLDGFDVADMYSGGGQLVRVELKTCIDIGQSSPSAPVREALNTVTNHYVGQVLTFVTGTAKNISTRIVANDHIPDDIDTPGVDEERIIFYVLPDWNEVSPNAFAGLIIDTDVAVVNGLPFRGHGAGGPSNALGPNEPTIGPNAMLPYRIGDTIASLWSDYLVTGVHEDYDAPDFNNVFLDMDVNGIPLPAGFRFRSFHRPYMINHVFNNALGYGIGGDNFTAVSLRPSAASSADVDPSVWIPGGDKLAAMLGTPEVDTDGDGELDSVWIDIGLPLQIDKSGRHYKPLVAVRIIDLDGRVNLNAHGNRPNASFLAGTGRSVTPDVLLGNGGGAILENQLPFGMGLGPAEISLGTVFSPAVYDQILNTRYGADTLPGAAGLDAWTSFGLYGHPLAAPTTVGGFYSSGLDLFGRYYVGFKEAYRIPAGGGFESIPFSLPMFDGNTTNPDEISDSQYEMVLAGRSPGAINDEPFTAKEMEAVLRRYDRDGLIAPGRLRQILQADFNSNDDYRLITHASYEVPSLPINPNVTWFNSLYSETPGMTYAQKLALRDSVMNEIFYMMPWEVSRRLPMDINRPFGNGINDNRGRNRFTDEHSINPSGGGISESNPRENLTSPAGIFVMDHDNDGNANIDSNYAARDRYARNLFALALIVMHQQQLIDGVGNPLHDFNGDSMTDEDDITFIAQWCINVVDFRDRDSVCTRFVFDVNPFNGWNTNVGSPDRRVVWGCERPELLLMESMALHDRRTEDLAMPGGVHAGMGPDPHFDMRLQPSASTFIEIYNPWFKESNYQKLPEELYENSLTPTGVDLQARCRNGNGEAPIWRLRFVKGVLRGQDPDDPDVTITARNPDVVRDVYFTDPITTNVNQYMGLKHDKARWSSFGTAGDIEPLQPGQYAVVGSSSIRRDVGGVTVYQTPIGRLTAAVEGTANTLMLDDTKSITLIPQPGVNDDSVVINNWVPATGSMQQTTRNNVVAIPVDMAYDFTNGANVNRSLGITEPVTGYPATDAGGAAPVDVGDGLAYTAPHDRSPDQDEPALREDGRTSRFCDVHLQRLANPFEEWDPEINPYLTIDTMDVDLVAFNGIEDDSGESGMNSATKELASFLRGWNGNKAAGVPLIDSDPENQRNIWKKAANNQVHEPQQANDGSAPGFPDDGHNYKYSLTEDFGLINRWYRSTSPASVNVAFPELAWNDRPYVSSSELALVPPFRSSQLLANCEWNMTGIADVYEPPGDEKHFNHLISFFRDQNSVAAGAKGFVRLLDFLEVPSRYTATETLLNPALFNSITTTAERPAGTIPRAFTGLNYPFCTVSKYKNPGKVNINTIADARVWNALMGTYSSGGPFSHCTFADLVASRSTLPGTAPTEQITHFLNPFRGASNGLHVPQYLSGAIPQNDMAVRGVDRTIFRPHYAATGQPLFDVSTPTIPFNNTTRNARPKYHSRTRIENLITTRSSVFAVWITVGKFEVSETGILGAELGQETGEVERHRGFFMIDRSIPVAFEPGQDHNVERVIIAESMIE